MKTLTLLKKKKTDCWNLKELATLAKNAVVNGNKCNRKWRLYQFFIYSMKNKCINILRFYISWSVVQSQYLQNRTTKYAQWSIEYTWIYFIVIRDCSFTDSTVKFSSVIKERMQSGCHVLDLPHRNYQILTHVVTCFLSIPPANRRSGFLAL